MIPNKTLLCILAILLSTGFADAVTLKVGSDQTYTTIQSAIDAADTGDIILVKEGTYFENPVIKKNVISLLGENKEKTIIDGKKAGSVIKIDGANNVIVSGLTVQNSGGSGQYDAGITLYSADNNKIANIIAVNNIIGIAIYSGSGDNVVSGSDIKSNSKYGILIFSSNDNKIYNNNVQKNNIGIYTDSARQNHIYSNNFIDNKDQAFDNSGMNSWDEGKSGNYWNTFKGTGAYTGILGGAKAKDNYPLSRAVTITSEAVSTPGEQKTQGESTQAESGKPSPGFESIAAVISLIAILISGVYLKKKN